MLRLNSDITIGTNNFTFVTDVELKQSWMMFTQTGSIKMPNRVVRDGETLIVGDSNIFKRGDAVTIKLGYHPRLTTVFEGYVAGVRPDSPFLVQVEDAMWLLKQVTFDKSFANVTLKDLLEDLIEEAGNKTTGDLSTNIKKINVVAVDANLGQFRIKRASITQVLQELRRVYGLVSWFRGNTLYAGLAYRDELSTEHVFRKTQNVIDSKLIYNREDDLKIKLKAISILPNNKKIEFETGDPEGSQRTLNFYNLSLADLKATAERELTKFKFEGYTGSFNAFGEPFVQHGDNVQYQDPRFPEQDGRYLVDQVIRRFGVDIGYKQNITLGPKSG